MKIRILALAWLGTASLLVLSSIIYPSNKLLAQRGSRKQLGQPFSYQILTTSPEAPEAFAFSRPR